MNYADKKKWEREKQIKDLYYLDEMIKSMHKDSGLYLNGGWTWDSFLRDWYRELLDAVGHSDEQREAHLRKTFGDEWYEQGRFLTHEERSAFLEMKI